MVRWYRPQGLVVVTMAYVYRHIRLDNNKPFYIGIGSDDLFKRSESHKGRNQIWENIINKTEYRVEIMLDNLTWEEACEKEREFIALYGRRDLGKGPLVNLTDGGEGVLGLIHREETKLSISKNLSGRSYESIHGDNADKERDKRKTRAARQWKENSADELNLIGSKISNTLKEYFKENPITVNEYTCPHCFKVGKGHSMLRWHFDRCRSKNLDS